MKPSFLVRSVSYTRSLHTPLVICYLSDLHFSVRSKGMASSLISSLVENPPDLILFGGDYLDTRRGEPHFAEVLRTCSSLCPTYAIGGNHDRFYGIDRIKLLCACNGVDWLDGETVTIDLSGTLICLHGSVVPPCTPAYGTLSVVILHEPLNPEELLGRCHLAFAGHLHGCQFVLGQRGFDLYPGKIFYRNNFLEWRQEALAYFISRGLGDTFPLRFNCPREIVRVVVD